MTAPRAAWRRARFGATTLLALLVLLVAVLAVGKRRGWPPLLQIGAPAWRKAPHLLRAEGASVELLWGDLWSAWTRAGCATGTSRWRSRCGRSFR
jgi:hypothetical protein